MSTDMATYDPLEVELFLSELKDGVGELTAGAELGWTPRKTLELLADAEFQELVHLAREQLYETLEEVLVRKARNGNQRALEMVLYSKAAHRGWRPPTQRVKVDRHEVVEQKIVVSVRDSVAELIRQHGPAALQPGGVLDAIDTTASDG